MGVEALSLGANVQTAFGALGLALVVGLLIYYRRMKNEELTLRCLPKERRARALDTYLTRYGLDARLLGPEETYHLISTEMDKRAARVTLLTVIIAVVFLVCFLTSSIVQQMSANHLNQKQLIPGDLSPIFGKTSDSNTYRVRSVPRSENVQLLRTRLSTAQKNIKIVTINGSSWIKPNLMDTFRTAAGTVPVTLLLLDYTDRNARDLFNDAMNQYGESRWSEADFRDNLVSYSQLLNNSSQLKIGLYNNYPWSRFTIFDDQAVSFIITPHVEAGDSVITYFSEDPFIVRCFEANFAQILESATSNRHVFADTKSVDDFMATHRLR